MGVGMSEEELYFEDCITSHSWANMYVDSLVKGAEVCKFAKNLTQISTNF